MGNTRSRGEGRDPMQARGRGRDRRGARIITLFGKRRFDFSFLPSKGEQSMMIRRALWIVPYYRYWLMVRVHAANIQNAGAQFRLRTFNTLPSNQDPQEFTESTSAFTVTIPQSASPGDLLRNADSNEGPLLKVFLTANQAVTPGRLYAELSAVLYCRTLGP